MFEWFWSLIGNKLLFLVNFFNLDWTFSYFSKFSAFWETNSNLYNTILFVLSEIWDLNCNFYFIFKSKRQELKFIYWLYKKYFYNKNNLLFLLFKGQIIKLFSLKLIFKYPFRTTFISFFKWIFLNMYYCWYFLMFLLIWTIWH
jgi:hypothetical protein